jgi:16S rRNA C1402 N4-methylase RsmH
VLVASVIVVGTALFGWLLWAALAAATPDTRTSLISFRVLDDRQVQVRFEVTAERSSSVACTLQAMDATGEVVGLTRVAVPPGPYDRRQVEAVIGTRSRAANATVAGCRLGADD